jgi:hypothetical protein
MATYLSAARGSAPWILVMALIALVVICIFIGGPGGGDVGSWRWSMVRPG